METQGNSHVTESAQLPHFQSGIFQKWVFVFNNNILSHSSKI